MSIPLLALGIVNLLITVGVGVAIRRRYSLALTSVDEKRAGLLHYYRIALSGLVHKTSAPDGGLCALHYLSVHLLVPLLGLGLYLRTDANFLVVILAGFVSLKLVQKVYPGTRVLDGSEPG